MAQNQAKISWRQLLDSLQTPADVTELTGLSGAAVPFALSQLAKRTSAPLTVVTRDPKDAEQLLDGLNLFSGPSARPLLFFPPYHITAYKRLAFHNETAAQRIKTLYQMLEGQQPPVTVTTMAGMLQLLLPKQVLVDFCELLLAGEEADRDALVRKLIAGGYTRTALVEEHGDFSLRGGILDIFAPLYDEPLRIEFFGDTVESIRHFSADTQRTLGRGDRGGYRSRQGGDRAAGQAQGHHRAHPHAFLPDRHAGHPGPPDHVPDQRGRDLPRNGEPPSADLSQAGHLFRLLHP
jgi:transcription-repair coupling factor (superfamily II helicase)